MANYGLFFDRDCRQELPHSPLPLTEEMAAKLYLLALDPERNELSPEGQKIALAALLNDPPQFNDGAEALPHYRQILGFCRILLQQGDYRWLRQQLSLTAMRDRCNQGLPVFELMLTRAIACQALGELAESDLSLLETALYAKLPEVQKQVTDTVYPNPLRDMIVWGFMDVKSRLIIFIAMGWPSLLSDTAATNGALLSEPRPLLPPRRSPPQ